ncbi:hypothetical protein O1611_g10468 [Lasiodiplodia mahajangana]|uniref:Uncharacterized protein n=1 Tax=Lasiodiplodia mahajangana TaxID=1108764 RepID=A0ACC2IY17_9PEZI|nr:hypothetical protein O1611_g10468 [Lasiodiplodia mahajangana]
MLAELGVSYARGSVSATGEAKAKIKMETGKIAPDNDVPVKFVDNDEAKTSVVGQQDIMLYLQNTYGSKLSDTEHVRKRFREGLGILNSWRTLSVSPSPSPTPPGEEEGEEEGTTRVAKLLAPWEEYAAEDSFIAGPKPSLADFAFWPVLRDILSSRFFSPSISPSSLSPSPSHSSSERTNEHKKPETSDKKNEEGVELPKLRAYHKRMLARNAVTRVVG